MEEDYYALLGVDRRASTAEIKRAYRRLTIELHPDRHPNDPTAADRFRRINIAYDTLSDPQRRARYDARRMQAELAEFSPKGAVKMARDLVSDVVGDLLGTRRRARRKGRDVRYTLTLDFDEAIRGTRRTIAFEAPAPCPACGGRGSAKGEPAVACDHCDGRGEIRGGGPLGRRVRCPRCDGTGLVHSDPCRRCGGTGRTRTRQSYEVTVPPGTASGDERVLEGRGEPGRFGGPPGDLRVRIRVRPHPDLVRRGMDLAGHLYVSTAEAATGAKVPAPSVHGRLEVKLPAGVATGTKLRVRGHGVRTAEGRGDAVFDVVVESLQLSRVEEEARVRIEEALAKLEGALAGEGGEALPHRAAQRRRLAGGSRGAKGGDPSSDRGAVS